MVVDKQQEEVIFKMALTFALAKTPKAIAVSAFNFYIQDIEESIWMKRIVDAAYEEALR
jgi:hypothetical protein